MKSIYQNHEFAEFWNKRAGETGEIYKRLILDPIMFSLIGSLKAKRIIELGCGNGYLSPKFIKHNPKSLTMIDISKYNLNFAKEKCQDIRINYIEQDVTRKWKIRDKSIDLIYSNMLLNEIGNIKTPIKEAFRVLEKGGIFIFSVTHPSWDLYVFAQTNFGKGVNKIKGLGNYFRRGFAKYIMRTAGDKSSKNSKKDGEGFEVEHYQRPLSDYFNTLISAGFSIKKIVEPELTEKLLKEAPRFIEERDHPIGLIFYAIK